MEKKRRRKKRENFLHLKPALVTTTAAAAARFFIIASKLPMELQMILCHRAVGSMKQNILRMEARQQERKSEHPRECTAPGGHPLDAPCLGHTHGHLESPLQRGV